MAAVMACGDGAVLSGRAAGHLLYLLKGRPPAPEVTAPTYLRVRGVTTRRSRLDPEETTTWRGIPTTTVPRTLADLAAYLPTDSLARACHEAGVRHGTTPAMVDAVLARRPNSGSPSPKPTAPQAAAASTAAGRSTALPSSSTATATTPPATPSRTTAAASERPTPAATSSAASPGATCSSTRARCWPSSAP